MASDPIPFGGLPLPPATPAATPNIPPGVAAVMQAQGGGVPMSLLELQVANGTRIYVADAQITAPSLLSTFDSAGVAQVVFQPWLVQSPSFTFNGTTATATANCGIQNLSGNTVQRDASLLLSQARLGGALFIYRLWKADCEYALVTVMGKVSDVDAQDQVLDLTLADFGNWSEIKGPDCTIDISCQNIFGTQQCGSVSPTPCQNTYGTCTQINRIKNLIVQWNSATTSVADTPGYAQPVPANVIILRRPS